MSVQADIFEARGRTFSAITKPQRKGSKWLWVVWNEANKRIAHGYVETRAEADAAIRHGHPWATRQPADCAKQFDRELQQEEWNRKSPERAEYFRLLRTPIAGDERERLALAFEQASGSLRQEHAWLRPTPSRPSWTPCLVIERNEKFIYIWHAGEPYRIDRKSFDGDCGFAFIEVLGEIAFSQSGRESDIKRAAFFGRVRGLGVVTASHASDCLTTLGLSPGASEADIKRAFRTKALVAHPDRGGTAEAFVALKQAYEQALAAVAFGSVTP